VPKDNPKEYNNPKQPGLSKADRPERPPVFGPFGPDPFADNPLPPQEQPENLKVVDSPRRSVEGLKRVHNPKQGPHGPTK